MAEAHNLFISWSGERSKAGADAVYRWFPRMLQALKAWKSDVDIEKGTVGLEEIGKALDGIGIGIICLTPENLGARWVLYEAGALSKSLGGPARVCTFLLCGLTPIDVPLPLGKFQATEANKKQDVRKLLRDINVNLRSPISEETLDAAFEAMWPKLEEELKAVSGMPGGDVKTRSEGEVLAEILALSRSRSELDGKTAIEIAAGVQNLAEMVSLLMHDRGFTWVPSPGVWQKSFMGALSTGAWQGGYGTGVFGGGSYSGEEAIGPPVADNIDPHRPLRTASRSEAGESSNATDRNDKERNPR